MPLRPSPSRTLFTALATTAVLAALIAIGRAQSSAFRRLVPARFGTALATDQAYYRVGDTAKVRFLLANDTQRDAHGWSPVRGGNGCEFVLTIEDAAGAVVYGPGTGCLLAETDHLLYAGSVYQREQVLPLIHRNSSNAALEGAPLEPGAYRVCFELRYHGPQPLPGAPTIPGTHPLVCVPIQIEP